ITSASTGSSAVTAMGVVCTPTSVLDTRRRALVERGGDGHHPPREVTERGVREMDRHVAEMDHDAPTRAGAQGQGGRFQAGPPSSPEILTENESHFQLKSTGSAPRRY